ncbi:unnamed protein product [Schistosoma curassoni]|uniref:Ras-related protein Rab-21 n=1 Tax=Schistosoma curassoni TaxID=6186 RepID=A0A183KWI5_9TREM|nr:unnamed protein product [Schistosoma curassoni]
MRYRCIVRSYFRKIDGVILMYAVDQPDTFANIKYWMEMIKESTSEENVPILLVGNKVDLRNTSSNNTKESYNNNDDMKKDELHKYITYEMGANVAKLHHVSFIETSVLSKHNITEAVELLTEQTIYLGTWDARTMWETGRVFQIAAEMRRYNLEVLGISETHWTKVGQQRLTTGELLLYSGHEEVNAPYTQGVALMLSKQAQKALIGWESHGPRIIKASFKRKKERGYFNESHPMLCAYQRLK